MERVSDVEENDVQCQPKDSPTDEEGIEIWSSSDESVSIPAVQPSGRRESSPVLEIGKYLTIHLLIYQVRNHINLNILELTLPITNF